MAELDGEMRKSEFLTSKWSALLNTLGSDRGPKDKVVAHSELPLVVFVSELIAPKVRQLKGKVLTLSFLLTGSTQDLE